MPIIESKSGYGYVFRQSNKGAKKPFIIKLLLILVILGITIFAGYFVAQKLPNVLGIESSLLTKKRMVYYIYCGEFVSADEATVFAGQLKNKGGAGYIKKVDNRYAVCLSCYANFNDAQKVLENLSSNQISAQIMSVELKAINMGKTFSNEDKKTLKGMLNIFYETYEQLYQMSTNYDNQTLSKLEVLEELTRLTKKIEEMEKTFEENLLSSENASLVYTKIYANQLLESLQNLSCKETNFSAEIKYAYIDCIELFLSLRQEIEC